MNKRVSPDSVMCIGNVVTGGTFIAPAVAEASLNMKPRWGGDTAAVTPQPGEPQVTPTKSADTPKPVDPPQPQHTPHKVQVMEVVVLALLTPESAAKVKEPEAKRRKTPWNSQVATPKEGGSPAPINATMDGMVDLSLMVAEGKLFL